MKEVKCWNCAGRGVTWLGAIRRMATCPICAGSGVNAIGDQEQRCTKCGVAKPVSEFLPAHTRCRACERASQQRRDQRRRTKVFGHYGWSCACCGTASNLTIDHVNGHGKEHRAEVGDDIYGWLISSGFPDGFQTLCAACNSSKGRTHRCRSWHEAAPVTVGDALDVTLSHTLALVTHGEQASGGDAQ